MKGVCDYCANEYEEDELRTVENKTLCDGCVEYLENNGELTRCELCTELFFAFRLKINPKNGSQEICPYCGEVWCE